MNYIREICENENRPLQEWERRLDAQLDRERQRTKPMSFNDALRKSRTSAAHARDWPSSMLDWVGRDDALLDFERGHDTPAGEEDEERDDREEEIEDEEEDEELEKRAASDHHLSHLADLVAEGNGVDRAAALRWLMHNKNGRVFARMHKGDTMQSTEKVIEKFKQKRLADLEAFGPVAVAKAVVEHGTELMIDEHEFTGLLTKAAQAAHPGLSAAQAFSKMFTAQTPDGALLRRAWAVIKAMPIVVDFKPLQVGGEAARAVNDPSEAVAQLQKIGADKWPSASAARQFARAFTDPANRELAAKAHQRPTAPAGGAYPYPR